ncbi:hypothetical protein [Peribacillus alkalitolerans]|nr:hypothetical protein [Peribacillus alkalitolerans]
MKKKLFGFLLTLTLVAGFVAVAPISNDTNNGGDTTLELPLMH